MATRPKCFRSRYDFPSELVEPVDLVLYNAALVKLGVKGGGRGR